MSGANRTGLLPHEWLCGVLFLYIWAQLVGTVGCGSRDALVFLSLMVTNIAIIAWCMCRETEVRWSLRLVFYPIAMNLMYFILATTVPTIHPGLEDELLHGADTWLFGMNLLVGLEAWIHPVLTEILSFCYLWYLLYLFSSEAIYFKERLPLVKSFYAGLFSLYAVGYFGYATVPALGPYLAMDNQFTVELDGWWISRFTAFLADSAGNHVDVFPSLHVANSLYILLFDYRHKTVRFRKALPLFVGLVISTLYLRYHYAVDVLCGALLGLAAFWLTSRFYRTSSA